MLLADSGIGMCLSCDMPRCISIIDPECATLAADALRLHRDLRQPLDSRGLAPPVRVVIKLCRLGEGLRIERPAESLRGGTIMLCVDMRRSIMDSPAPLPLLKLRLLRKGTMLSELMLRMRLVRRGDEKRLF